ncbi:MAG TPA: 50S ribosomal protein L22 [Candidatus Eremiobacteraceae bacterium]|nr:50S ribosomal protein L22 [Candidatus Eremiobacteraceae bacterium]
MQAHATVKFLKIPARKARRVVDVIRGKRVDRALVELSFSTLEASKAIHKLLRSAAANAENNHGMKPGDLVIARATVDGGPMFKRVEARARGSAGLKRRRMSHVTITVSDGEDA